MSDCQNNKNDQSTAIFLGNDYTIIANTIGISVQRGEDNDSGENIVQLYAFSSASITRITAKSKKKDSG